MKCTNPACGADIAPGSRFCGKCGTLVAPASAPAAHCTHCGNPLVPGSKFCGKCGASAKPAAAPPKPSASLNTEFAEAPADHPHSGAVTKAKSSTQAMQLAIVALAISLCIAFTGLAGNFLLSRATERFANSEYFTELDDELAPVLGSTSTKRLLKDIMVALIKDDSSRFAEVITEVIGASGLSDDGLTSLIAGGMASQIFSEARAMLKEEAGKYWTVLLFMAYGKDLLKLGLILLIPSAAACFLLGVEYEDVDRLHMSSVKTLASAWMVLICAGTALVLMKLPF